MRRLLPLGERALWRKEKEWRYSPLSLKSDTTTMGGLGDLLISDISVATKALTRKCVCTLIGKDCLLLAGYILPFLLISLSVFGAAVRSMTADTSPGSHWIWRWTCDTVTDDKIISRSHWMGCFQPLTQNGKRGPDSAGMCRFVLLSSQK